MEYLIRKDPFQDKKYVLCKEDSEHGGFHKRGVKYNLRGLRSRLQQVDLNNISFDNSELEDEINTEIAILDVKAEGKRKKQLQ